jgi:cytochrome c oxidase subunit 1
MALTETRPDTDLDVAATVDSAITPTVDSILGSGDHKTIGRLWIGSGLLFLVAGLVFDLLATAETADLSGFAIADGSDQLTQIWSLGRDLLLFAGLMPVLIGIAVFIVPLQVGSSSIAFPRGAAAAFWTWLLSVVVLVLSYIMNGGPAGGRVDYVVLWTLALGVMVAALLWALVCVATTILGARASGMDLEMVPVTSWGFLVFATGSILALPVMLAELVIAYLDVKYGFLATKDSRAVLVNIADSVNLVPALYFVAVPTLAMAVDIIGVHTGRPPRFHKAILAVVALLGFMAYGADMLSFAWRGRPVVFDNGLLVVATIGAVLPILLTLALAGESIAKGRAKINTPFVASLAGGVLLVAGAATALLGVIDPILGFAEDIFDQDIDFSLDVLGTSFHWGVRGFVIGAVILGVISAVHHWGHKIWGRTLDDRIGFLEVLAVAAGSAAWGVGNLVAGFLDQPGLPVVDPGGDNTVELMNVISTVGIGLVAGGVALLVLNVLGVVAGRVGTAAEPWTGATLEWATASPPIGRNFAEAPVVSSAMPMVDMAEASVEASSGEVV